MTTKTKNPLRDKYKFNQEHFSNGKISFRGYCTHDGYIMGLGIFYHDNGNLFSIGIYEPTYPVRRDRKIGYWKYYNISGSIKKEIIYIK